jgi:hypothetical protein
LKIPLLLVQYLYKNRKMSLPGLGIFTLDKSVVLPDEHDRTLLALPNAVQFQNANIAAADKELITFICENTGKIRPLAISDLDSYLNLGTEMLNIGKPFYLEGIGTISKNKSGKFDFTPGEYAVIRENTSSQDHDKKKAHHREKKQLPVNSASQGRNGMIFLAIIAAIAIVGWGGWMMYKKSSAGETEKISDTNSVVQEQVPATDSMSHDSTRHDSAKAPTVDTTNPSGLNGQPATYKFIVLSTYNKPHALRRYNQLLGFNLKIHMYQKDSTFFKVYFQFPALAKDTTHIKDSLRREYAHEIIIEQ